MLSLYCTHVPYQPKTSRIMREQKSLFGFSIKFIFVLKRSHIRIQIHRRHAQPEQKSIGIKYTTHVHYITCYGILPFNIPCHSIVFIPASIEYKLYREWERWGILTGCGWLARTGAGEVVQCDYRNSQTEI